MDRYFKERRTVRKYSDRPVPEKLVEEIVEAAAKAPTCGNMQLYTVIATTDPEVKSQLAPLHFNQPCFMSAPVVLTVCADYDRFSRWCRLSDADPGYDNLLSFMSACADAYIFAQQIVTIAEKEGLGTCYLGTVTYNAEEISKVLDLPELVVPVACITLGWKDDKGEETERIKLKGILHKDRYAKFSNEEIMDIYRPKDEFPANAGYVKENGKDCLAQVFTDIRYPRAMNEEFSAKFLSLLRKKRFL